jgi:hypothetical protein
MSKTINPQQFSLPARTVIEKLGDKHYVLVINRKSRVIMADGKKIMEKAEKIKVVKPGAKISLRSKAPVCSKTIRFLADQKIELLS